MNASNVVLGLDIGTTTICGVAVTSSGEILTSVEKPNDSVVAGLPTGRVEQDPIRIRERAAEVLRGLTAGTHSVAAVGLTGQMHGMLCVDSGGRPLGNLITWQDGRCLEPAGGGRNWLESMRARVPEQVWAACGCRPASGYMGSSLYWLFRNGELPTGTVRVSFVQDWIAGVLTGELPVTDPSDAGSAGILDLVKKEWHEDIIRALGFPAKLLPPIRPSGEIVGHVVPHVAAATGLKAGTPVCNAIGDNQASFLGSCNSIDKSILVNFGTGGQISWAVPEFVSVPGMETRYLPHNRYMLVGASLCGGRAFAWLSEVVQSWMRDLGVELDREAIYAKLCSLAASAPSGAEGLSARTLLAGTRADPTLRGSFEGVSLDNFSLANVYRAVLEGMAEEVAAFYDLASGGAGRGHDTVIASGNAVRRNAVLREIISARLKCPVRVPKHREEASYGAALLAGVSAGFWPDLDEAGRNIQYGF